MSCLYCGGSQREERNPNRCWGCGAAVPREPEIHPGALYPVTLKPGTSLADAFVQIGRSYMVDSDVFRMQQLQNDPRGGLYGIQGDLLNMPPWGSR